jgi:hypothetical protein
MSESILQQTIVSLVTNFYPEFVINLSLSGIQLNGTAKQKSQIMQQMRREGFRRGLPDLTLYLPDGVSLQLELKTDKGKQSDDQILVESQLKHLEHNYNIIRTVQSVFDLIIINTPLDYRTKQFDLLLKTIPSNGQFLHYPAGTPISTIKEYLKPYFIAN